MAEVRCPMCGKPNPADAEVCRFCSARLKPLVQSGSTGAAPDKPAMPGVSPAAANQGEDLPDWLNELRGAGETHPEDSPSPSESQPVEGSAGDVPDWLARIRQHNQGEEGPVLPEASNPASPSPEESSDWLDQLRSTSSMDSSSAASPTPEGNPSNATQGSDDLPAWLTSLGESNQPPARADDGIPDWLAGLGELPSIETIPAQPEKPAEASPAQPVEPGAAEESLPDWLASLDETPSGQGSDQSQAQKPVAPVAPSETPDVAPFEGALPDWLSDLRKTPASDAAVQLEQPAEPTADVPEAPSAAPSDAALPDWLTSLQQPAASEAVASASDILPELPAAIPEAPSAAPLEEPQPDWLAGLQEPVANRPAASEPEVPTAAPSEGGLPDWLAGLQEPAASEPASTPFEAPATAPGEEPLPDWLASLQAPAVSEPAAPQSFAPLETPAAPSEAQTPASGEPGMPDWLAELGGAAGLAQPLPSQPVEPAQTSETTGWQAEVTPDNEPGAAKPAELPDWLAGLRPIEISKASTDEKLPAAPPETGVPEWVADSQGNQPAGWESTPAINAEPAVIGDSGASDQAKPFISEDLPDWLAKMELPGEVGPAAKPTEETAPQGVDTAQKKEEESGLEPAELPGWVQKMRPIETATPIAPPPAEVDERQEKEGPLAGLRGILPAEAFPAAIRKPPIYTTKLQITDKQRINAALFDNLLATEAEPQAVEKESPRLARNVWSVLIALALILVIWFPMWTGGLQLSLPGFNLPETNALQQSIDSLPAGATVLVVCDYEPAMVGEMEAVSTGVMAHLLSKSANIVLISTNPTGAVLGEQLLQRARAASSQPTYSLADKTVNLGYLAGGTSALLNFATYPQMAAPVTVDGSNAWEQPILKNLVKGSNPLLNLAQIIVITPDVDTARAWIEQVQPAISKVPLLFLTSAQSAPMIGPYVDSGQVHGMVAGVTGGSLYEQNTQRPSVGQSYWDSYQLGILLLVVLIIVGGLVNAVDHLIIRRNKRKGA